MFKRMTHLALFAVLLLALGANASAQEKDPSQMTDEEKQEMAAKVYALMEPGEQHEMLKPLVGSWDVEMKYLPQPGADPITFQMKAKSEMILGGRFLKIKGKTEAGMMSGESLQFIGFNRRHEKFTAIGLDTFGTYYVTAAGTYDKGSKTITMRGTDEDPIMGHTQEYDFVVEFVDADTWKYSVVFHDKSHGNEEPFKMVELTYRRSGS